MIQGDVAGQKTEETLSGDNSATGVLIEPFSWLLEIDYSSAFSFSS